MKTNVVIVMGYDNELTQQDIVTIKTIKKRDKDNQYDWSLLYYVPYIPAQCFLEKTISMIDQFYRDEAKAMLYHISRKLDIPLPMKDTITRYNDLIESGSVAITYAVRKKEDDVILTSQPDKLKLDLFDKMMNQIMESYLWQRITNQFLSSKSKSQIIVTTPEQFVAQDQNAPSDRNKIIHQRLKETLSKNQDTIRQKTDNTISSLPMRKPIRINKEKIDNEKRINREVIVCNLKL